MYGIKGILFRAKESVMIFVYSIKWDENLDEKEVINKYKKKVARKEK